MRIFFERAGIREHGGDEKSDPQPGETREWRGEQYECVRNDGKEASFQKSAVIAARRAAAKPGAETRAPVAQGDSLAIAAAAAGGSEPGAPPAITTVSMGLGSGTPYVDAKTNKRK